MESEDKQQQQEEEKQQAQQAPEADYEDEVCTSFDSLPLDEKLLRGIYSYGFEKPSAIQMRGIKPIIDGHDTIGQAQSGTGKTATFVIAALQKIDYSRNACQVLILAPTRELAQQIQKVCLCPTLRLVELRRLGRTLCGPLSARGCGRSVFNCC